MLTYSSNIQEVFGGIVSKLSGFQAGGPENDKVMRAIATAAQGLVRARIHQEGKKANGQPIGQYSNAYLKYRVKKKNRENDSKVVLSLNRNMENDFQVIATDTGYGLGFNNPENVKKADWLQNGTKATTVKEHERVLGRKSTRIINNAFDSIARIEDQISEQGSTPDLIKKLNRARNKFLKSQGRAIKVRSYQRAAWKGYGKVYGLTNEERDAIANKADQIIEEIFKA